MQNMRSEISFIKGNIAELNVILPLLLNFPLGNIPYFHVPILSGNGIRAKQSL